MNKHKTDRKSATELATPEAMIESLDERIAFLKVIQQSIIWAYYGEMPAEIEAQTQPEVQAPARSKPKAKAVATKPRKRRRTSRREVKVMTQPMILEVLGESGQPLTADEIYAQLQSKGWTTTSKKPRNLLTITLRYMTLYPKSIVRTGDGRWDLTARVQGIVPAVVEVAA